MGEYAHLRGRYFDERLDTGQIAQGLWGGLNRGGVAGVEGGMDFVGPLGPDAAAATVGKRDEIP